MTAQIWHLRVALQDPCLLPALDVPESDGVVISIFRPVTAAGDDFTISQERNAIDRRSVIWGTVTGPLYTSGPFLLTD